MSGRGRTVALVLVCLSLGLAGCQSGVSIGDTNADEESETGTVPTVVVGIENDTNRHVAGPLREAVAWWNERDGEYEGPWEGEFVVRPDADDPDIVAEFAPQVDCERGLACAPNADSHAELLASEQTLRVAVDRMANRAELVHSLKHELGHVRGVGHCQAPHWLMGCPDSAERETAHYVARDNPWRNRTDLAVYVGTDDPDVRAAVRATLEEYKNSTEMSESLRLREVDDPWLAHVVVTADTCDCPYGSGRRQVHLKGGQGYDTDERLEYLYWAEVTVTAPEDGLRRGVGNALARVLAPDGDPE